ncbi:MAG: F0F1 ATP synthase subunit B family protein [Candidatus Binatia bacterium]
MTSQDFLGLFTIAQAWAAGGAEHHVPSITEVIFPALNFLIYALIIIKFALPPVRSFLQNRRDQVVATMAQASAKKAAAQALVDEYKAKLAALDQQVRSLQATLRQEGERDKAKLVGEANAMAVKIKADASILADQEVKMARQKIREDMAIQAEATARALLQRNLSVDDQNRLADEFIQSIGQAR